VAGKAKNLLGRTFSRLKVIGRAGSNKRNVALWYCLCECGGRIITRSDSLQSGHTTSCGCAKVQHGQSAGSRSGSTAEYRSW
jgi:hypothetical protein